MKDSPAIPNLFGGTHKSGRYSIYHMVDRWVQFTDPSTDVTASGFVDDVYRDVLHGEIRVSLGLSKYTFKEPSSILREGHDIILVYGDSEDIQDQEFFDEVRNGQLRETMRDTVRRFEARIVREIRFSVGDRTRKRRKRRVPG